LQDGLSGGSDRQDGPDGVRPPDVYDGSDLPGLSDDSAGSHLSEIAVGIAAAPGGFGGGFGPEFRFANCNGSSNAPGVPEECLEFLERQPDSGIGSGVP
jgi:hypothetical protein